MDDKTQQCGVTLDLGRGVIIACDKPLHRHGEHRHTDNKGRRTWWS